MPSKNTNSKKEAGRLKKQGQADLKAAKEAASREEAEAKDWQCGANLKGAARSEAAGLKTDEAARKKKEKMELLAAEEAELGSGGKVKTNKLSKKKGKGKKKGDDLGLLDLVAGAEKKKRKHRNRKKRYEESEKRNKPGHEKKKSKANNP